MATSKFYLDTRSIKKDGTCPLKLSICKGGKSVLVSIGVCLAPNQWEDGRVIGHKRKDQLNIFLQQKKLDVDMELLRLESEGKFGKPDKGSLKQLAEDIFHPEKKIEREREEKKKRQGAFIKAMKDFKDKHLKKNTRNIYQCTINALYRYCPDIEQLGWEDITKDWIERFDLFLAQTSPSRNARNIHLRNIRAVFNNAIDNEQTTLYPFRRIHLRYEPTRKRSLPVEEIRRLFNYPVEDYQRRYLDCFKLIFLLIGINISDLCGLRPGDYHNGRIEYRRNKTGRLYNIKVEPEAGEIIERYRGEEYLLNYLEAYNDAGSFMRKVNKNLKLIGPVTRGKRGKVEQRQGEWPQLSTYWARHTWATVASSLDVPIDVIGHALGHSIGFRITSIYIDFDMRKVDEANRRVIDWVMYEKK